MSLEVCELKKTWVKRTLLLSFSLVLFVITLLLLEAGTRILKPQISFQDTERSLLREKAFGETNGWVPNASGICFGKTVFTDDFGFRKMSSPEKYDASWLILGDSVTFGVGVETKDTYVQLLQNNFPTVKLWNTAVIGYDLRNYRDVLYHLVKERQAIPNLRKVILFFCLNDVVLSYNLNKGADEGIERSQYIEPVLSFLRRNSKFYILMKNTVSDRSLYYFQRDYQHYKDASEDFAASMKILDEINGFLRERNINLSVVILPYEYQLRKKEEQYLLPQKLITAFLKEKGISYTDAYESFVQVGDNVGENFLYADFTHLSTKGHQVIFNLLKERLKIE